MNPYLQIARDHLTIEELEMLIAERKRVVEEVQHKKDRKAYYTEFLNKHL